MKKFLVILVALALINVIFCSEGWTQSSTSVRSNSTTDDELNLFDHLIARPFGFAAGITGTAVFIVTLPFTFPTKSTGKAADMLINAPFRFTFSRPTPDPDLRFE